MIRLARKALNLFGIDLVRTKAKKTRSLPSDIPEQDRAILQQIEEFTMTSIERQATLVNAVRHLVRTGVPGSFVECGVWRGGSSMAIALTLLQENAGDRDLFLFDTFEGMTPPTDEDRTADGISAQTHLDRDVTRQGTWCVAGIDDVKANMASTKYPGDLVTFIKGPVEETIPFEKLNGKIALLRLDTDWYASTKHELEHLFPMLQENGILIIDDYGHWEGARKAVDEYFANLPEKYFMHRIDTTGRILVKK